MKKLAILLVLTFLGTCSYSQDHINKSGQTIETRFVLPKGHKRVWVI